ncbi:hypothetical protein BD779DRAFT_1679731 [Infundibulicybe gibba]|nr:hypothetical protein BD779DRAFT_1679731 [Infundibulicybe gibba]
MSTAFNNICSILWSYLILLIAFFRSAWSRRAMEVASSAPGTRSVYRQFVTNPFKTEDVPREPNPRLDPSPPIRGDFGLLPITRSRQLPKYKKSPKFIDPPHPTEYRTPKPKGPAKGKGRPRSGSKLKIIAYPEPFDQLTPEMVNRVHLHPYRRHAFYRVRWEEADKRALRESLPPPKPKGRRPWMQYNAHIKVMKDRVKAAEDAGKPIEWFPEYYGRGECVAKSWIPDESTYLSLGIIASQSAQNLAELTKPEDGDESPTLEVATPATENIDAVHDIPAAASTEAVVDLADNSPADEATAESTETSPLEGHPATATEDELALALASVGSLESNMDISEHDLEDSVDADNEGGTFNVDLSDGASFSSNSTVSDTPSSLTPESSENNSPQGNPTTITEDDELALALASVWSLEPNLDISAHDLEDDIDADDEGEMFDIDLDDGASFSSTASNASSSLSWELSPGHAGDTSDSSSCSSASSSPPSTPTLSQTTLPATGRAAKFASRFNWRLPAIHWKGLISGGNSDEEDDDFTWVPPTRDWPFNDPEDESIPSVTPTTGLGDDMV